MTDNQIPAGIEAIMDNTMTKIRDERNIRQKAYNIDIEAKPDFSTKIDIETHPLYCTKLYIGDYEAEIMWDNNADCQFLHAKRVREWDDKYGRTFLLFGDDEHNFHSESGFIVLEKGGIFQKPLPDDRDCTEHEWMRHRLIDITLFFMELQYQDEETRPTQEVGPPTA